MAALFLAGEERDTRCMGASTVRTPPVRDPTSGSAPFLPGAAGPTAGRVAYLDAIKIALVAGIIAGHGALGYSDLESAWPYQDVQEVTLHQGVNIALVVLVLPAALFAMGLFFLVSGLVTPPSLTRKGSRVFVHDRLVRL